MAYRCPGPLRSDVCVEPTHLGGVFLAALGILGVPSLAYADGGTALTTARGLHLLVGNFLIGFVEGLLIGALFRVRFCRSIPAMILANYASTFAANFILRVYGDSIFARLLGAEPLYALPSVFRLLVILAFIESFLVEWPFCLWAMTPVKRRLPKSVLACLIAQVVSYAALIPIYRSASEWSLYTEMTVDRSIVPSSSERTVVYFVSAGNDSVWRINLNGTGLRKVSDLDGAQRWPGLFFRRGDDKKRWDLCAECPGDGREAVILKDLPVRAAGWRYRGEGEETEGLPLGWPSVWDLRTEPDPAWTVEAAKMWLVVRHNHTSQWMTIGLETPLLSWYANCPTILPEEKVVCQFGDQILLLDLDHRRVGFLTRGRSPVVAIEEQVATAGPVASSRTTSTAASRSARDGGVE